MFSYCNTRDCSSLGEKDIEINTMDSHYDIQKQWCHQRHHDVILSTNTMCLFMYYTHDALTLV